MENKNLKSFKDLNVWQKSADLAVLIYKLTEKFPHSEIYGITNQMRRAVISISSNLAEGFKRTHKKEKLQFYNIAHSSTSELESQIEISKKLSFLSENDYQKIVLNIVEVSKMINGLIKSFNSQSSLNPQSSILNPHNSGQILTELIIAIAITVILAAMGAQLVGVSLYSAGSSKDRQAASRLAEEVFEALRGISQGNTSSTQGWNRVYLPPDGSGNQSTSKGSTNLYKIMIVNNIWEIASGTEIIILDGEEYSRSLVIENVCRDNSTKEITGVSSCNPGSSDDPGTQKVTVTISKTDAPNFILSQYFTRYLNEATPQTSWSGGVNNGPFSATSTTINNYSTKDCVDPSGGTIKLNTTPC